MAPGPTRYRAEWTDGTVIPRGHAGHLRWRATEHWSAQRDMHRQSKYARSFRGRERLDRGQARRELQQKTLRIGNYLLAVQQVQGAACKDGARRARVNTRRLRGLQGRHRSGGTLIPHTRRLKVSGRLRTLLLTCVHADAHGLRHLQRQTPACAAFACTAACSFALRT
jgi:hypothetical protein